MQADDRQAGRQDMASEGSGDLPRMERPAVLPGEHETRVDPGRPPGQPLGRLVIAPGLEPGDGGRVEGDRTAALRRLGLGDDDLVADRDQGSADRDPGPAEVDVGPLNAEDLAAAHPGGGGQQPEAGLGASGRAGTRPP